MERGEGPCLLLIHGLAGHARTFTPALVERYASLRVPVGIRYGAGDRILNPQVHGEGMRAWIEGVRLEMIEGGHMISLTAPDRVAAFIRAVDAGAAAATETSMAGAR